MRDHIVFYLNGERHEVGPEGTDQMLADYLRGGLGLTGTKVVCSEGDCGACTVLRRFPLAARSKGASLRSRARYLPVNSCITTLAQLDGSSLVSIDALAKGPELTPVQIAIAEHHGSQCGYCTPGFVMALTGAIEARRESSQGPLSTRQACNATTGNLCRCTGYQQILDAATRIDPAQCESLEERFFSKKQERELLNLSKESLLLRDMDREFFAPTTIREACRYLSRHPRSRVLGAGTDLGVFHNKRKLRLSHVLSLHLIHELYELRRERSGRFQIGARVTLAEWREFLKTSAVSITEEQRGWEEWIRFLDLFASPQIKNIATLAGNIANASPIADSAPLLLASDALVVAAGPRGQREIPIAQFFVGYRQTALKRGELITSIRVEPPKKNERIALFKVSERKDLDISAVNMGIWIRVERDHNRTRIVAARVAFGGVADRPLRLRHLEKALAGHCLEMPVSENLFDVLQNEIEPLSDVRGSKTFRRVLAESLLRKSLKKLASSTPEADPRSPEALP